MTKIRLKPYVITQSKCLDLGNQLTYDSALKYINCLVVVDVNCTCSLKGFLSTREITVENDVSFRQVFFIHLMIDIFMS